MNICIISDGKIGHLSQTRGLAQALIEQAHALAPESLQHCLEWEVQPLNLFQKITYKGEAFPAGIPAKIDLVLCAGHSTHIAALRLAKRYGSLCFVCMSPSLPLFLFDLAIIPQHDLKPQPSSTCEENKPAKRSKKQAAPASNKRIFPSYGALNPIRAAVDIEKKHSLILIGGPSKEYAWNGEAILAQLEQISAKSNIPLLLSNSRRTPENFLEEIAQRCPNIQIEAVENTPRGWLAQKLQEAQSTWVTQDSVSMIYEALSSGAPVGILAMERKSAEKSRVARGLDILISERRVQPFAQWEENQQLHPAQALQEAQRAALYILEHFPQLKP